MILQNILSISNDEFVVHKGNHFAYQYLVNNTDLSKKVILYGNSNDILEFLFKKYSFYSFRTLEEYKNQQNTNVYININSDENDNIEIFHFLNFIYNAQNIFLVVKSDNYPIDTSIKDLNSRLNSFLNIYVNNSEDIDEFQKIIISYFKNQHILVNDKVIRFLSFRLNSHDLKKKIDFISEKSLILNRKITIDFIKSLDIF